MGIAKDDFVRVFRGKLTKGNVVEAKWADVDRKNNGKPEHGDISFKITKSGNEAESFQEGDSPKLTFYRIG